MIHFFSTIPLVNASNSLSKEEQKELTKMEKVSLITLVEKNYYFGNSL